MAQLSAAEEVLVLRMFNCRIIGGKYTDAHRVKSRVSWEELGAKYSGSTFEAAVENLMKKGLVDYHGKGKAQVVSLSPRGADYARMLDKLNKYPDEKPFGGFRILKRG